MKALLTWVKARPFHAIGLERSADLEHWEPVITTAIPLGQRVTFVDLSPSPALFYRVR